MAAREKSWRKRESLGLEIQVHPPKQLIAEEAGDTVNGLNPKLSTDYGNCSRTQGEQRANEALGEGLSLHGEITLLSSVSGAGSRREVST